MKFNEMQLDERILKAVKELGYEEATPIQTEAIPVAITGRDILGQAQTGTGKTAAFSIPILNNIDSGNKHLQAVVLCPTRDICMASSLYLYMADRT